MYRSIGPVMSQMPTIYSSNSWNQCGHYYPSIYYQTRSNSYQSSENYEFDYSSRSSPPSSDSSRSSPPISDFSRSSPPSSDIPQISFSIDSILGLANDGNMGASASVGNRDAQIFSGYNSLGFSTSTPMMATHLEKPQTNIRRENNEPAPDGRYSEFQFNPLITDANFMGRKLTKIQAVGKIKRARTTFTAEQMNRLEAEFSRTQYMAGHDRVLLAHLLNLKESQVKIWFQNRRIKYRKQLLESQKPMLEQQKHE